MGGGGGRCLPPTKPLMAGAEDWKPCRRSPVAHKQSRRKQVLFGTERNRQTKRRFPERDKAERRTNNGTKKDKGGHDSVLPILADKQRAERARIEKGRRK